MVLTHETKAQVKIGRKVEFLHIVDDFYAYRSTIKSNATKKLVEKRLPNGSTEGLILKKDIPKKVSTNTKIKHFGNSKSKKTYIPFLVNEEFITKFKRNKNFMNWIELINLYAEGKDFFKEMSNPQSDKRILVFVSFYDHTWYDHKFRIMPKVFHFDYVNAGLDNSYYHLEEVLKHIKKRDDVELLEDRILDIPYYNQDDNSTKYLEFWWYPSVRVMRDIYRELGEYKGSFHASNIEYDKAAEKLGLDKFEVS